MSFFTWIFLVFLAGASDRLFIFIGLSYGTQIWLYRVLVWVAPVVALVLAKRICVELQRRELIEHDRKAAEEGRRPRLAAAE
jgi:ubiquinol-cytochrome c reductase cytochrome b subunit